MSYIKQLLIIMLVSFIGELLNFFIPLPIPGSIYGMVLMFVLLCTGIIKISQVKGVSVFLIDIMPMLFIPSAVGIMSELEQLQQIWVQITVITLITTIITMAITGLASQAIICLKKRKGADENGNVD